MAVGTTSSAGRTWFSAVSVGLVGGLAAIIVNPLFLIAGLIGIAALFAIPVMGHKVFWAYLLFLLFGYLFLGKGFAYIGVAPVYVAEIGLALGAVSVLGLFLFKGLDTITSLFRPEVALLLVFLAWQTLCTIPHLPTYGIYALRDAALWGYAAFALLILLMIPRRVVDKLFVLFGRMLPYYLMWLIVAWVFVKFNPLDIHFPGSPVPIIHLKSGDVGVHLAGTAAFMLLRLDLRGHGWSNVKLWLLWSLWIVDWIAWGASNRGGMFSALIGIGIVLLWRPRAQWQRPLAIAVVMVFLLFVTGISVSSVGSDYGVSGQQMIANVTSTFGGESSTGLQGTKKWRQEWWQKIVGYTFGGEHFWTGKGYGINLTIEDGFVNKQDDDSLRAPHNAFMSILARSGVPGLVLWLVFLMSFGAMLARRASARRNADAWDARYAIWLLAYWLAYLFNGSLDVFLEGPMGGVWFWSIVGISLVYFTKSTHHSGVERDGFISQTRPDLTSESGLIRKE